MGHGRLLPQSTLNASGRMHVVARRDASGAWRDLPTAGSQPG